MLRVPKRGILAPPVVLAGFVVILLLVFPLLALRAATPDVSSSPPATEAEREKLISEILELDVRLAALNQEKAQAQRRLEELREDVSATRQEKERLTHAMVTEQQNVALWLRFLAEDGALTYLDVLLGAADLHDLLQRLDVIITIIEGNVKSLEHLQELSAAVTAKELTLAKQQAEIMATHAAIVESVAATEDLRRSKARALAEAERKLADFATVVALSQAWETVLPDLEHLVRHLPELPWSSLQPDTVEVNYLLGRAYLAYNEATLAALLNAGLPLGEQFKLECISGHLILNHPAVARRPAYTLTLNLEPDSRRLHFQPLALTVNGITVPAATLALVFAGQDLALDLPLPAGLKISGVQLEDGQLRLTLTR